MTTTQFTARVTGPDGNFDNQVNNFEQVTANLINGGTNVMNVAATDFIFNMYGQTSSVASNALAAATANALVAAQTASELASHVGARVRSVRYR